MTENSKHTPGPWTVTVAFGEKGELCFHEIRGPDERTLASTWGDPHEANARLIAAAPELLAALHATRNLVSEAALTGFNCHDGNWAERLFANQASISAAIAKAAGK